MITSPYKIYKKIHMVISEGLNGFEIQTGELSNPQAFIKNQTILITGENPNLLWDLLHNLIGVPYPQLNPVKPPDKIQAKTEPPPPEMSPLETELNAMSSREILKKLETEKGVTLTLSPKSKKAIIKRALALLK